MIIWAVDPTQKAEHSQNLMKEMKIWSKLLGCKIQPVSIFNDRTLNLPVEFALPWMDKFDEVAQGTLDHYFKKVKIEGLLKPEMIIVPSGSRRKMALELASYAEKKKAMLICAESRGKQNWNPFRLGGFAETLVATSKIPVLLMSPKAKPSSKISSVLFPTDFSRDSHLALKNLSPWLRTAHTKAILYNQVETPAIFASEFNSFWPAQSASLESLAKDVEKGRIKKANRWTELLKKEHVESDVIVQRQKRSLGSDILSIAKKNKVDLIALTSRGGPLAQTILGSVAKDVLVEAACPVIVFHRPKLPRKQAGPKKQPQKSPQIQKTSSLNLNMAPESAHSERWSLK